MRRRQGQSKPKEPLGCSTRKMMLVLGPSTRQVSSHIHQLPFTTIHKLNPLYFVYFVYELWSKGPGQEPKPPTGQQHSSWRDQVASLYRLLKALKWHEASSCPRVQNQARTWTRAQTRKWLAHDPSPARAAPRRGLCQQGRSAEATMDGMALADELGLESSVWKVKHKVP
ncbi:hypothetical protein BDW66DRAFT_36418 [Aspergillus desertorum]